MHNPPHIEFASLSHKEDQYVLKFDCKDWKQALNCLLIESLEGFVEFIKDGELLFKEMSIKQLNISSFIQTIEEQVGWHLIRFDLKDTVYCQTIDFYTGELSVSFTSISAMETYMNFYSPGSKELLDEIQQNRGDHVITTANGFYVLSNEIDHL